MSTTVSYKGQTLTTVSNDTKTLLTEGKYLEDDLTLTDVSGGGAVLTTKNISANGTYNASSDSADGYSQVVVDVPNSYSQSDEGKVVSNGALVAQTAHADVTPTTSDQTIDTTTNNSIKVKGDADLVASNIKKDVEIFGVTGSYEGGGGGISADDIATHSYTHISLSVEQITRQWTFAYQNIETVDAPNLKTINGDNNFYACKKLKSIIFPELTSINGNANFAYSGEGTPTTSNCILVFPKLALGGVRATFDRGMFAAIDIGPNTTYLYADTFYHNTGNQIVGNCILRRTEGVVAANTAGSINGLRDVYVPSALISDYQAATNWSTKYSGGYITFHAIEGSQYENYYADGTPISA